MPAIRPRFSAWVGALALAGLSSVSSPGRAADPTGSVLPLTRVRLYETGVGYFERTGKLQNGTGVGLPVPAGHLDDALKTLVILNAGGATNVSGIEFGSSLTRSMGRALAGLSTDQGTPLGFNELLTSLKGVAVEVQARTGTFKGRLVDVVEPDKSDLEQCMPLAVVNGGAKTAAPAEACVLRKQTALVLLTERAEIRRFSALDVVSVRPNDPAMAARLRSALDALSQGGARARQALNVMAKNGKSIALGYVAEAPIWRSTYRLMLEDAGDRGTLQGWALLHNDTAEDWKGVQVELVNGRPDSFLFPFAAPRYARRELVTPENELSTVPQLLDSTVDNLWSVDGADGLGLSGVGEGGGGRGEGIGLGSVGTLGHGAGSASGPAASSLLSVGNLASLAQATGVETGALFRYALKSPLDLHAHSSVLVPFVTNSVKARRIAWFEKPDAEARSAVHFENATGQTLPPGTVAVFGDGGFSGESAIERMKPKESTIVRYGVDLDVELSIAQSRASDRPQLFSFQNDALVEHFVRLHEIRYGLKNRSGSARSVYLELDFVDNARVTGADRLDYDSQRKHGLLVFEIGPHGDRSRDVKAEEGLRRSHPLAKLSSSVLRRFAATSTLDGSQREILERAAARTIEAEVREAAIRKRKDELAQVEQDIARLRENLRAAGRGGDSAERLVERLLAAEDSGKALRARIAALKGEAFARRNQARAVLAALGSDDSRRKR